MAVLITELLVDVLQVAEGQLGRVRGLAQSQVADPLLDHVAVGTGVHCNWPHSVLCTLSMCTDTRQMHTLQTLGPLLHLSPLAIFLLAFCCSELDSLPPSLNLPLSSLEHQLIALNAALLRRLGGQLAEDLLRLRLVICKIPSGLERESSRRNSIAREIVLKIACR